MMSEPTTTEMEYMEQVHVISKANEKLVDECAELRAKLERAEARINELEQNCDILSGVIKTGSELSSNGEYYATADLLKNHAPSTQCGVSWLSPEKVKDLENKLMSLKIAMGLMLRVTDRTEGVQPTTSKTQDS